MAPQAGKVQSMHYMMLYSNITWSCRAEYTSADQVLTIKMPYKLTYQHVLRETMNCSVRCLPTGHG